jgi:ankyrin repeat protein
LLGYAQTVQLLLENGASVDISDKTGRTALYYGKEIINIYRK